MKNKKLESIKKFNFRMGMFHFIQAIFMLIVALNFDKVIAFKPDIWTNFLTFDNITKTLVTNPVVLFALPFGLLVSLFLFISTFFHFLIVSSKYNKIYNKHLISNINSFIILCL